MFFSLNFKDNRYDIQELKRHLIFLKSISNAGQKFYIQFLCDQKPPLEFHITSSAMEFIHETELTAIEAIFRILTNLEIHNPIKISIPELQHYSSRILEMDAIFSADERGFCIDVPHQDFHISLEKDIACLSFLTTPIGQIFVGVFAVMIGKGYKKGDGSLKIYGKNIIAEKILIKEPEDRPTREDLISETRKIIERYELTHTVLTRIDERNF